MASSEPLMDPSDRAIPEANELVSDFVARDSRTVHARLDEMAQIQATMLAGLERMIEMLDGFANRAEPLLTMAEKRARRGALFSGGK